MFHHREKHALDIVGIHEVAAIHERTRLRHAHQVHPGTRTCRQTHAAIVTRRLHQRNHVTFQRLVNVNLLHFATGFQNCLGSRHRRQQVNRPAVTMRPQDFQFGLRCRVTYRDAHQESVHLRFGQRENAVEFHRILSRQDHEKFGQFVALPLERNLSLFHRLQKRALRARRGTVDFVGQQHLRKNRPLADFKLARIRLEHGTACHVGRQQIRRKLDSRKIRTDGGGKRLRERRLARTGNIFHQHVTVRQQRHYQ